MISEPQILFANLWSSIKQRAISVIFPSYLQQFVEKTSQYIYTKLTGAFALRSEILLTQKMLKPIMEPGDYYQRLYLRSLVGLPPVPKAKAEKASIKNLKGCISWISTSKIDVTELIREIRDS